MLTSPSFYGACSMPHHVDRSRVASRVGWLMLLAVSGLMGSHASTVAATPEWNQFRGPAGDGRVASDQSLPLRWSEQDAVAWKTETRGRGWSSPVIAGDRIWVTTAIEERIPENELEAFREKMKAAGKGVADQMALARSVELLAIAIDANTGHMIEEVSLFKIDEPAGIHSLNSYASPTPIALGQQLLCHFGSMGTALIDVAAKPKTPSKVRWTRVLPHEHSVGPGSSPVVWKDRAIIPCDGMDQQYVVALDLATGKVLWKADRPPMDGNEGETHKSFCTPVLADVDGRQQAIIVGAQWVVSYDPATGKEWWRLRHGDGFSVVPVPVLMDDQLVFSTGYMRPELVCVGIDGAGDVTASHLRWRQKKGIPTMPSPVVVGDLIYVVSDQGIASCLDGKTGKEVWTQRLGGNYSAALLAAGDHIYAFSQDGVTHVFRASRAFEELATSELAGRQMATPAVLAGDLILRTDSHLYRIHAGPAAKPSAKPTSATK